MAGLYIHIPFCASRCIYCGFYSTTLSERRGDYVDALCREMKMTAGAGAFNRIGTIYLGGGTPSQLSPEQLQRLFTHIYNMYSVDAEAEITLECNPDDVTTDFARALKDLPINRVSMGAQTFSDERLRFLRRRHTASQVGDAVEKLRAADIQSISIDLMYGFPDESLEQWDADIAQALSLAPEHLSAYCLTIEEGTPLRRMLDNGAIRELDEETERAMYERLIDRLEAAGYVHYEISNFARRIVMKSGEPSVADYRSRHNSSYWDGTPYLGLGAAAHSYDGQARWWNVSSVEEYIRRVESGVAATEEKEQLDAAMRYNDLVMTALRTREGLSVEKVRTLFGVQFFDELIANARPHVDAGRLVVEQGSLRLTRRGLFVSDGVMADLMYVI